MEMEVIMGSILKQIDTSYIDAQTLLNILRDDYKKPRERILLMVKKGELIRLKNGFYLIADKITHGRSQIIPYEQIANLLYGPSYVSLEWALSFYSFIPERVYTVTSMTIGRNKEFRTSVGDFSYTSIPEDSYAGGIVLMQSIDYLGNFFIASPEKALIDLVYAKCRGLNKEQLKDELIESRRIDDQRLRELNKERLYEIANNYKSKAVKALVDMIGII